MSTASPVPFLFQGTQLVRTVIGPDGEPRFVAADICLILEIKNVSDAVGRLRDDEKGIAITDTLRGPQEMIVISESGLYAMIFRSRKPAAEEFRYWVTKEVLPQIRKTGRYDARRSRRDSDEINAACRAVAEVRRTLGPKVAGESLPTIFAKVGIHIPNTKPDQGELDLQQRRAECQAEDDDNVVDLHPTAGPSK